MTTDEIYFLYNEIEEKVNKDIEKILFQIRNPQAGKHLDVLEKFTRAVIYARAKQLGHIKKQEDEAAKEMQQQEPELAPTKEFKASVHEDIYMPQVEFEQSKPQDQTNRVITLALIVDAESEEILAQADITSDFYNVQEPEMSEADIQLLHQTEHDLNGDPSILDSKKLLHKQLAKSAKATKHEFYSEDLLKFKYYLVRNLLSFHVLEPLTHDPAVNKIICDGPGEPIIVIRENKKLKTNVFFASKDELNRFMLRIAEKTFQHLSIEEPVLDAVFRNFRIQGILGTDMVPTRFIMTRV